MASAMAAFCGGSSGPAVLVKDYKTKRQSIPKGSRVQITHENGRSFFGTTSDGACLTLKMTDFEWERSDCA